MPEPEKGLELNIALVKQLTGGDTYTARNLNESPVEFSPEFKLFINTNHLPHTSDDTIFTSGRVKLIPFDRHFTPEEQDAGLKMLFRESVNMSGILNWLIEGYRLMRDEGLSLPEKVKNAIAEYRLDADDLGAFFKDTLVPMENNRLKTSELWEAHNVWAKANGIRSMSSKKFVGELRRRYEVKSDCKKGNVIVGYRLEK
jgi:putative DNA primase/helicase